MPYINYFFSDGNQIQAEKKKQREKYRPKANVSKKCDFSRDSEDSHDWDADCLYRAELYSVFAEIDINECDGHIMRMRKFLVSIWIVTNSWFTFSAKLLCFFYSRATLSRFTLSGGEKWDKIAFDNFLLFLRIATVLKGLVYFTYIVPLPLLVPLPYMYPFNNKGI